MAKEVSKFAYACRSAECGFYKVMNNGPTSAHFKPGSPIFAHPTRCSAQLYCIEDPLTEAEWKSYCDSVRTLRDLMEKLEKPPVFLRASADWLQESLNEWFEDAEPFTPMLPSSHGMDKRNLHKLDA